MLGIGAGGVKCTEVRTSWLSSGHALPCSREVCGQIGFLRGYGVDMDLGLEQASKERSTSSWPARWPWILLQIYPHHQSALRMIPCALEFRNRSRRPAWVCKQMHPQLMTLFYNLLFKKSSLQKNKNSIHGVNCTLQIVHIVLLYGTEALHLTWKYDRIARFFARSCLSLGGMRMVPIVKDTRDYRCSSFRTAMNLVPPTNRHWHFEYPFYWIFDG